MLLQLMQVAYLLDLLRITLQTVNFETHTYFVLQMLVCMKHILNSQFALHMLF